MSVGVTDRWTRAFERAEKEDLTLINLGDDATMWAVTSSKDKHRGYLVRVTNSGTSCQCVAGKHEMPCKHVAKVLAHLRLSPPEALDLPLA